MNCWTLNRTNGDNKNKDMRFVNNGYVALILEAEGQWNSLRATEDDQHTSRTDRIVGMIDGLLNPWRSDELLDSREDR